jgi:putative flippase GtrA
MVRTRCACAGAPGRRAVIQREFLRFALLGGANTLLTLGLYWLLLRWTTHTVAYALAYAAGIVFSAVANARYTFGTQLTAQRFATFAGVTLLLYAFNAALLEALVRWAGVDPRLAVLVVVAVSVPLGFIGSRRALRRG